jgi:hypothetical protein
MRVSRKIGLLFFALVVFSASLNAQVEKVKPVIFDGVIHFGYVNNGGYINFSGPSLSVAHKNSKFMFGMLPSLRFKKDKDLTKNATVYPTLGFGFTYGYKFLSFQLPFYYNTKSTTNNGSWHMGVGVGFRINALNK